jgi:carbamoyltransferase
MNILGISCFFHDAAAALAQDGIVTAAAEEERFSRIKHDASFPIRAVEFCLRTGKLRGEDLDWVVFYEKPFVKFDRLLMSTLGTFPRSFGVFRESMIKWLGEKLWVKGLIRKRVGISPERILFSSHHLSHAASAFYCSPYSEAAVLTVDGVGEWATATLGVGRDRNIELLGEIRFPHSLGLLYSVFTAFLGFEVNEGEYKVMGMAPYGTPKYADDVRTLLRLHDDGGFSLDMDYFSYHHSPDTAFNAKFARLFGAPRDPKSPFFTRSSGYPAYFGDRPSDYDALCERNQHYADIAASIQLVTEETLLAMARALHAKTGLPRLCMAGGVALNSVANGRILRETPFEELYTQPAAGDAGGAVGAALYVYHAVLGHPRKFVMEHAYLGEEHSEDDIKRFLDEGRIRYEYLEDDDRLIGRVVDALASGKVIGWSQGRFEWGPRALGNRSILADPRRADMKDIVNTKIKFREPYRPFAPSVLVERAEEFYDLAEPERHYPARFMLLVVPVKEEKREVVPAPTHVDGTGRLQTVFKETNPRYHHLIEMFGKATGVPVVLNTSFNLKGEPIVNTPREAFSTFMRSGIDLLVLDRFIVVKGQEER